MRREYRPYKAEVYGAIRAACLTILYTYVPWFSWFVDIWRVGQVSTVSGIAVVMEILERTFPAPRLFPPFHSQQNPPRTKQRENGERTESRGGTRAGWKNNYINYSEENMALITDYVRGLHQRIRTGL